MIHALLRCYTSRLIIFKLIKLNVFKLKIGFCDDVATLPIESYVFEEQDNVPLMGWTSPHHKYQTVSNFNATLFFITLLVKSEDFKVFSYAIWWSEYEKNTDKNHWGILDLENLKLRSHFIFCASNCVRKPSQNSAYTRNKIWPWYWDFQGQVFLHYRI